MNVSLNSHLSFNIPNLNLVQFLFSLILKLNFFSLIFPLLFLIYSNIYSFIPLTSSIPHSPFQFQIQLNPIFIIEKKKRKMYYNHYSIIFIMYKLNLLNLKIVTIEIFIDWLLILLLFFFFLLVIISIELWIERSLILLHWYVLWALHVKFIVHYAVLGSACSTLTQTLKLNSGCWLWSFSVLLLFASDRRPHHIGFVLAEFGVSSGMLDCWQAHWRLQLAEKAFVWLVDRFVGWILGFLCSWSLYLLWFRQNSLELIYFQHHYRYRRHHLQLS